MNKVFDVTVIGAGVSGLSASICCATEGFSTILVDGSVKFGGQAGEASLIENLIGFPDGITGAEFTKNAIQQANRFGVIFKAPFLAVKIEQDKDIWKTISDEGEIVLSKTIILAVGQKYKKLDNGEIDRFLGTGVFYGSPLLSDDFKGKTVSVVGGANSAGQASVYLSKCDQCNVNLIVRGKTIENSMSQYLYEKINNIPNIKVFLDSEIVRGNGICSLDSLTLNTPDGEIDVNTQELFILIGAKPKTKWLSDVVKLDEDGFIITDEDLRATQGVFCIGDARSQSTKRVACAIGEGGKVIKGVRARLKELTKD